MGELDLSVEMRAANGAVTRWGSEDSNPADVPQGITFGTRLMHGFADCSLTLSRRIDDDYFDLSLADELTLIGGEGSIAYEGRVGAIPKSYADQHTVSLQAAGWMSHATDRKFTAVYIDRDLNAWTPMSRARRATLLTVPAIPLDPSVAPDASTGSSALVLAINAPTSRRIAAALYDAGVGNVIATVYYTVVRTNMAAAPYDLRLYNGATDTTYSNASANLATGAGSTTGTYAPATAERFVHLALDNGAGTDLLAHEAQWTQITLVGDQGLTFIDNPGGANGFAASDVIADIINRYCPLLSSAGVLATTYPVPQVAFKEGVTPYDAFLDLNKYHLWDLSCWEDKTVHYGPLDYTDYDWEIRTDEPGTQISLQGDSIEDLANGIVVQYTNAATGASERLTPDVYSELEDTSVENPFNAHGYPKWTEYTVSFPTTQDAALQIGRTALAEFNAPKAPGSITETHTIRDRAGHAQPVWKVRAGDRVAITSSANLSDRPRIIHETSYSHDSKSLTMSVEGPAARQEAVNDRIITALQAAGLT